MVVHFARSCGVACFLSIIISSALSATCSASIDCTTNSTCTVDFCEPLHRVCLSLGPATCPGALLTETSRSVLLRAAETKPLNRKERLEIIFEAERMFRDLHPHRPLHLNFLKVDPVDKLRTFAREVHAAGGSGPVAAFHHRMIDIFRQAQDLHTHYSTPLPLRNALAVLPFQVREYYDPSTPIPNYIVSDVAAKAKFSNSEFKKGVQLVSWNGVSISEAVMTEGNEGYASNRHAKHRRGLKRLTVKQFQFDKFPLQDYVEVEFITAAGRMSSVMIPWIFVRVPERPDISAPETPMKTLSTSPKHHTLARPGLPIGGVDLVLRSPMRQVGRNRFRKIAVSSNESKNFDARIIHTQRGTFGMIRVHNFLPEDEYQFLSEMLRVILQMPTTGLVFDLRGNDGGVPPLCQYIVQLFTEKRVIVTSAEVRKSPLSLKLARIAIGPKFSDPYMIELMGAPTRQSDIAEKFGDQYFGLTRIQEADANSYEGERYNGPVVVLVDAETYSCGDIFAAVVQDSGAATLVGVDQRTGGGGSLVLTTKLLQSWYPDVFNSLPGNVEWSFSHFRLARGGKNEGIPMEYFGVTPDIRYNYTKADRLDADRDLNLYLNDLLKRIGASSNNPQTPIESPGAEFTPAPSTEAILI